MPRLCQLYPGICLTAEEKARKTLSEGSRRVPVGTMKIQNMQNRAYITIRIHKHNNKNTQFTELNKIPQNITTVHTVIKKMEPKGHDRM